MSHSDTEASALFTDYRASVQMARWHVFLLFLIDECGGLKEEHPLGLRHLNAWLPVYIDVCVCMCVCGVSLLQDGGRLEINVMSHSQVRLVGRPAVVASSKWPDGTRDGIVML